MSAAVAGTVFSGFRPTASYTNARDVTVLFGIPGDTPDGLAWAVRLAPSLRWVATTAAGAGQQVTAARLTPAELDRVTVTRASGPHAGPLAEFTFMALLAFTRGLSTLQRDKAAKRWSHSPVAELRGRVLVVLGTGAIGQEMLRLGRAVGMHSIGVRRRARSGEVPATRSARRPSCTRCSRVRTRS